MPDVDDRIRAELRRLRVDVDGRDAFERVTQRRRRIRRMRTTKIAAVATLVAVGTVAAGLGLRALLAGPEALRFGDLRPSPTPPAGVEPFRLCGASSAVADLDGDGADDRIRVGVPALEEGVGCGDVRLVGYVARIRLAIGTDRAMSSEQPLPDCAVEGQCWILGAPDLDRDGRYEVAITTVVGVSTLNFSFYRLDVEASEAKLRRLAVATPGDPFDDVFGFPPGSASFSWYGSVTHQHWVSCDEGEGEFAVITMLRDEVDADLAHVHATVFTIQDDALVVASTRSEVAPDGSIGPPPDLCGEPLGQRP